MISKDERLILTEELLPMYKNAKMAKVPTLLKVFCILVRYKPAGVQAHTA